MSKYRIRVIYGGYIPQKKHWCLGWIDLGAGVLSSREDAERYIDRNIEITSHKDRYIEYP